MYKSGTLIQLKNGSHVPYSVHLAVSYAEFGDRMPNSEQNDSFNVYSFYDEHRRLVQAYEHQLELWTPHDDVEAWVSQFGPDTWVEFQWCKRAAEWIDGLPEDILTRRLAEKDKAS